MIHLTRGRGRRFRITAVAVAFCAATLLAASPAPSKSPHQVDPATLQPALNPDFAPWDCFHTGQGITCQGTYTPVYNEPIGLECDGQEVWISGHGREFMTRWHTSDGLATRTVVHLDYPEDVFSFSPDGTGPTLVVSGHFNRHYVYPVPGDRDARQLSERGQVYLAKDGRRVVLRDVGTVTFQPGRDFDFEGIASMHGVHDFYSDPEAIGRVICEALTGAG